MTDSRLRKIYDKLVWVSTIHIIDLYNSSLITMASSDEQRKELIEQANDNLHSLKPEDVSEELLASIFQEFRAQLFKDLVGESMS